MKRKLLFFLALVAMLTALLAVAVSADTIYVDKDGEELFRYQIFDGTEENYKDYLSGLIKSYQGEFPKTDANGNALSWYVTSTESKNGDTVKTVDCFVTVSDDAHMKLNDSGAYSYVNQARELSLVAVYFPDNSNVAKLNLTDGGYGVSYSFKYESELLFLHLPNTLTELPGRIGQATPILEFSASDEALYTSMSPTAFHDSRNLCSVDIPKNVEIIYSNGHSNNGFTFYNCVSLTDVNFAEGGKLKTIQINAFNSCRSLKEITVPNTVVNLGERVFQYCNSLEVVRLGANAGLGLDTYNVQSMLYGCSALKYVYISETMMPTAGSHMLNGGSNKGMVYFYTGDYSTYEAFKAILVTLKDSGNFTGADPIKWDSTKDDQYYKDLAANDGKNYVVYGYGKCEAFYGGHTMLGEENVVVKSYFETIDVVDSCKNCGAVSIKEQLSAIFTYHGYSCTEMPINGVYSMSQFFGVNDDAKAAYVEKTGKEFEFGLVAASINNPMDKENEGAGKAIVIPSSSFASDYFFVKITGITSEHMDSGLVFCAYVIDGGEVFYLDGGKTLKSVECKSYNDVKALDGVTKE